MASTAPPAATRPRETLFLLVCRDAPGSATPREAAMREHLAHVERLGERIVVAGPALDAAGRIDASVFVLRAADAAAARALLETDPYFSAGVWGSIELRTFRAVCGSAVGGITWDSVR
jgi:hypothetical protein